MTIGDRIREIRRQRNMSQKDLAQKLGVTTATISKYERGQRQIRFKQLEAIAEALNTTLDELAGTGAVAGCGTVSTETLRSMLADIRESVLKLASILAAYESMLFGEDGDA